MEEQKNGYTYTNAESRRKKILEILNIEGKIKVRDLSQRFDISEVTIRSDLADLEKENVLERVHGGAIPSLRTYYSMDFYERKTKNVQEKLNIAAKVASLVRDGDTLMLSSGTTAYFVAREIKQKKNIKVVTNAINVANELSDAQDILVVLLGGNIKASQSFTFGYDTLEQLKKYKADKAILSVDGVSADIGISIQETEELEIYKMMIERSNRTIAIADYSKVGVEAFTHVQSIDCVDCIITNEAAPHAILDELTKNGIEVICV